MTTTDPKTAWKERLWFFYRLLARLRLAVSPEAIHTTPTGARFYINRHSYVERLIESGGFEQARVAYLCELLVPGDVFLDIGANIGFFTVLAARCGASVRAFEPDPLNYQRLLRNVKLNGFSAAQVEAHPWALGRESGEVLLHRPLTDNYGRSSIIAQESPDGMPVPLRRLDDLLRSFDSRYVVKVDVEGAELQVLEGATGVLDRMKPGSWWLVEVHRGAGVEVEAVAGLFTRHGYRVSFLDDATGKVVLAAPDDGDVLLLAEKLDVLSS